MKVSMWLVAAGLILKWLWRRLVDQRVKLSHQMTVW